jgi:hypothetical protein
VSLVEVAHVNVQRWSVLLDETSVFVPVRLHGVVLKLRG